MLDIDPFLGDQIRVGGLGGLGGMPPPEPSEKPAAAPQLPMLADDPKAALREGIAASARALGIDPVDLATAISYETAGTFDPTKRGPTTQWGQHRGLIQFGVPQAKQHGVDWNDPLNSQLGENGAVVSYLRSTGVKPGMGLLDIYSAINAGGVGLYNRTDANNGGAPGTVRDKVERQMAGHRRKAEALFGGGSEEAPAPMAFTAATQNGDVPPAFARSLGQSQVPVSPMAGRIAASLENPGANAMPDEPQIAGRSRGVQVASLGNRAVPPVGPRPSPSASPMPVQGQPAMMEDYARGPDNGVMAFLQMQAAGVGDNSPTVGGLGSLGGMRMPQPAAAPVPGPSGPPQGQQQASQPQSIDAFLESRIPSVKPNPLAFFGKPALENQMAERERQTAIGMAKAMIAQGVDPNIAASLVGTPEGRAQLVRMQERNDNRAFQEKQLAFQIEDKKADNARADKALEWNKMSEPAKILYGRGITKDHPDYTKLYDQLAGLTPEGLKQVKTSLTPVYGEKDGKTVLLQPNDRGEAVLTKIPEGVTVAKDPRMVDTGTGTAVLDPVTRQVVSVVPKNLAEAERQKEVGTAEGKSDAGASSAVQTAKNALDTIEKIRTHPGRNDWGALGKTAALPAILGGNGLPGQPSRGFVRLVDQAAGQAFLQAFESLKGGGQITQVEGDKATAAIARLDRTQDPKDFEAALKDLESVIKIGKERAEKRITVPWNDRPLPAGPGATAAPAPTVPNSTPAPAPSAPAAQFRYNPATGKMESVR